MIRTMGLNHIALTVRDLDRSFCFYQQVFGAFERHRGPGGLEFGLPDTNDIISLTQGESAGASGNIEHFGFRLVSPGDADAAAAAVVEAGGTVEGKGEFVPGEPYVFARDPDGYIVEIWYELESTPQ